MARNKTESESQSCWTRDSERRYGPLSKGIIDQPPWDRDERLCYFTACLITALKYIARALDLWSTAISRPKGFMTFSSSQGREGEGIIVQHGDRALIVNFSLTISFLRESDRKLASLFWDIEYTVLRDVQSHILKKRKDIENYIENADSMVWSYRFSSFLHLNGWRIKFDSIRIF